MGGPRFSPWSGRTGILHATWVAKKKNYQLLFFFRNLLASNKLKNFILSVVSFFTLYLRVSRKSLGTVGRLLKFLISDSKMNFHNSAFSIRAVFLLKYDKSPFSFSLGKKFTNTR